MSFSVQKSKSLLWSVIWSRVHTEKPFADLQVHAARKRQMIKAGQQGGRRARAGKPAAASSAGSLTAPLRVAEATGRDVSIMVNTSPCVVDGQR